MAEGVRADIFVDVGFFAEVFDDGENHHAGQLSAATVEEKVILVGVVDGEMTAHLFYIKTNVFQCRCRDWDEPCLVALAGDFQESFVGMYVADTEIN